MASDFFGNGFQNGSEHQYEYIFSEQGFQNNQKKKPSGTWKAVLAIILCVTLSVGAGFFGVTYYFNELYVPSDGTETKDEKKTQNGDVQSLVDDPSSIVSKSETEHSIYGSAGEDVFAISEVVRKVKDTVVVIEATVTTSLSFGRQQTAVSAGSGIVISENGYILTCNHVVEDALAISVTVSETKYDATLVGTDPDSDLAVLKIDAAGLTFAEQGCSSALVVGENVVAIGNPLGTLGGTVTHGIISATERTIKMEDGSKMTLIQTDTAINSGNSGGGLFNLKGQLIGVVNAKYSETGVEGLAFAIPIDSAYDVELDLIQYGYVRGIVDSGLSLVDVTSSNLRTYQYTYRINKIGVYVVSSSYCEDLKNKDLIVSIDGTAVTTSSEVEEIVKSHKVGDVLTVVASRDGIEFTTTLELQEYVPDRISNTLT